MDFRTEIGRSQKSHFLFLNIARRPHITQSDLVFFNLSGASCIFGHVDINEVIYFHACRGQIRQSQLVPVRSPRLLDRVLVLIHLLMGSLHSMPENEKNQGGCHTKERKGAFFKSHFPKQSMNCSCQDNRGCCEVKKQSNHASSKWGALMKHSGR